EGAGRAARPGHRRRPRRAGGGAGVVIREAGGDILEAVTLFDVYTGEPIPEGQKSVAFSLVFRDPARTLTDEEVAAAHERIVAALERAHGAKLRG
ncbi:hypothetical protein, partial [Calditerricola satsumensis]|uniref:phenylalanine--tRNA ligase subunit beta-related protein n=1 Tax=Calditerricola satsumensis TaxID=373054 RepID=UPI00210BEC79